MRKRQRHKRVKLNFKKIKLPIFFKKIFKVTRFLLLIFLTLSLLVFLFFYFRFISRTDRVGVAFLGKESVYSSIFDFKNKTSLVIKIPSFTEVESARRLGQYPLRSIWQLSYNENLKGELFRETIVSNFGFPVFYWANESLEKLTIDNNISVFDFLFKNSENNLSFKDKIDILFLRTFYRKKIQILDLVKTQYIEKKKTIDSEVQYIIKNNIPPKLLVEIIDTYFNEKDLSLYIENNSGSNSLVNRFSRALLFLGLKPVRIYENEKASYGCRFYTKDLKVKYYLIKIFNCEAVEDVPNTINFDVEIFLGEGFLKRF